MATNLLNFTIDQGSSYSLVITVRDQANAVVDLTLHTARVQVRKTYGSATVINGTIANGALVLTSAVGGVLTWNILPTDTAAITWANQTDDTQDLVYDVEVTTPTGAIYKPIRGTITLNREVTR